MQIFLKIFLLIVVFHLSLTHFSARAEPKKAPETVYETITIKNLSRLYWVLGRMDLLNDEHIDNFLIINDCETYTGSRANEFIWKAEREKARAFLEKDKGSFPIRYQIVLPLFLQEYDFEREGFPVHPEFTINGKTRFEIRADDYHSPPCKSEYGKSGNLQHYPFSAVMEITRPVLLDFIPVPKDIARKYLLAKTVIANDGSKKIDRDAYFVMKVKFFASGKKEKREDGVLRADLLAILEGVEVYADPELSEQIFSKSYIRKKKDAADGQ